MDYIFMLAVVGVETEETWIKVEFYMVFCLTSFYLNFGCDYYSNY